MSIQVAVPNPDSGATQRTAVVEHREGRYVLQDEGHLIVRKDSGALGVVAIYAPGQWVSALQA